MKLLIIDDEEELAKSIVEYLQCEGYHCEVALTLEDAMERVIFHDYDCLF